MKYCIDTSSLIDSWRLYPIDVLPDFWSKISEYCDEGTIIAPDEVINELSRRDGDELFKWARTKESLRYPLEPDLQWALKRVMDNCKSLININKIKSGADPIVIALAIITNSAVISEENRRGGTDAPLKIPDACDIMGVKHVNILAFIREQKWVFKLS